MGQYVGHTEGGTVTDGLVFSVDGANKISSFQTDTSAVNFTTLHTLDHGVTESSDFHVGAEDFSFGHKIVTGKR